jgi:NAD(P)H-quinone oxidoreductase subunit K
MVIKEDNSKTIYSLDSSYVTEELSNNIILTTLNDLHNWARLSSLWPLLYGTSCCFIEFASLIGSRFDFDRFGLVPRSSPRQADLIITAGTVTMKMAPSLVRLYEQMPEPKYIIAMGACTITGGMFSTGCPPKPEAIIDAVIKLRKKVAQEDFVARDARKQTHRFHTVDHGLTLTAPIYTGNYLQNKERQSPPKEFTENLGVLTPLLLELETETTS